MNDTIGAANPSTSEALRQADALPAWLVADLRSDHAGEVGAVCIYRGVLAFSRDPAVRAFALRHRATEEGHLQRICAWLPAARRSRLLQAWRLAGWLTGAIPALFGARAVYATIEAVERFVDEHYEAQIRRLDGRPDLKALRQVLEECQADEVAHRDEASQQRGTLEPNRWLRMWTWMVDSGSRAAVSVCRRI